jgi:hypothetical protein
MTVLDGVGDEFLDDQHEPQHIVAACNVSRAEGFDKGGGFGHDGEPRGERARRAGRREARAIVAEARCCECCWQ